MAFSLKLLPEPPGQTWRILWRGASPSSGRGSRQGRGVGWRKGPPVTAGDSGPGGSLMLWALSWGPESVPDGLGLQTPSWWRSAGPRFLLPGPGNRLWVQREAPRAAPWHSQPEHHRVGPQRGSEEHGPARPRSCSARSDAPALGPTEQMESRAETGLSPSAPAPRPPAVWQLRGAGGAQGKAMKGKFPLLKKNPNGQRHVEKSSAALGVGEMQIQRDSRGGRTARAGATVLA